MTKIAKQKWLFYLALFAGLFAVALLFLYFSNRKVKKLRNMKFNSRTMRVSEHGKSLIKKHEGLRLTAYLCPAKVWTIGYGSTGTHVREGMTITRAEADALLEADIRRHEPPVQNLNVELTQNQFDALVSFVFNIGAGAFATSTIRRKVLANPDDPTIADEFRRWNKASGVVLNGLVNRRNDELKMYFA